MFISSLKLITYWKFQFNKLYPISIEAGEIKLFLSQHVLFEYVFVVYL